MKRLLIIFAIIFICSSCEDKYNAMTIKQDYLIVSSIDYRVYPTFGSDPITYVKVYLSSDISCADTVLIIDLSMNGEIETPYHLGDTLYLNKNK